MKHPPELGEKLIKSWPKIEATAIGLTVSVVVIFFFYLIYTKSLEMIQDEIKRGLMSSVSAAATTIDGDLHGQFNAQTSRQDPLYLKAINSLEVIRQASTDVRYIYTNIQVADRVYFILNPSPQNDNDKDGRPDLPPALMDEYTNPAVALLAALKEGKTTVTQEPYVDEWGTFISAYAPFFDKNKRIVGTLGMDYELRGFYARLVPLKLSFEKAIMIIIFLGLMVGMVFWLARKYSVFLLENIRNASDNQAILTAKLDNVIKENHQLLKTIKTDFNYTSKQAHWIDLNITYLESQMNRANEDKSDFTLNHLIEVIKTDLTNYQISLAPDTVNKGWIVNGYFIQVAKSASQAIDWVLGQCNVKNAILGFSIVNENVDSLIIEIQCILIKDTIHDKKISLLLSMDILTNSHDMGEANSTIKPRRIVLNYLKGSNGSIDQLQDQTGVSITFHLKKGKIER